MSYRFPDPNPVLISLLGTESAADGTLQFYDYQTTTPKATYSDRDLTIPNANPVELDASGRAETEIWLDGEYTVVLRDADNTVIWTRDVVPEVSPTTTLPDPTTLPGGTVKSNGTGYELVTVLELPDPTDSAGYMPVVNSDGTGYNLQPQPEPPEIPDPEIVVSTSPASFRAGVSDDTTKFFIQAGSGSAPASGTENTQVSVTFAEPFAATPWHISIEQTHDGVTSLGVVPQYCITARSASGFTVRFSTEENSDFSGWNITSAVPFTYAAFGTKTVT
jgi:hypothetical protein